MAFLRCYFHFLAITQTKRFFSIPAVFLLLRMLACRAPIYAFYKKWSNGAQRLQNRKKPSLQASLREWFPSVFRRPLQRAMTIFYEQFSLRPASDISRMRVKNCIGMLRNWRLLLEDSEMKTSSFENLMSRRSVEQKVLVIEAMNSSELVLEDFGFLLRKAFPYAPLAALSVRQFQSREW